MKTRFFLLVVILSTATVTFSQQKMNVRKHYLEIGYSSSAGFLEAPNNDFLGFGITGGYAFKNNNNYYFAKVRLHTMLQFSIWGSPDEPSTSFSVYEIGYGRSLKTKNGEWLLSAGLSATTFVSRGKPLYSYGGGGDFFIWGSTRVYESVRTTYLGLPIELKYIATIREDKLKPFISLFTNINKGGNIYGGCIGVMLKLSK